MSMGSIDAGRGTLAEAVMAWGTGLFLKRPLKLSKEMEVRFEGWVPPEMKRRIDGADSMLREWACDPNTSHRADSDPTRFAIWLISKSDHFDRHKVVENWDWEQGMRPIEWIALNSDTARATALAIFWKLEPSRFVRYAGNESDVPSHRKRVFRLLKEIKVLIDAGFYREFEPDRKGRSQEVAYVPPKAANRVDIRTYTNREIYPAQAFEPIAGSNGEGRSRNSRIPFPVS